MILLDMERVLVDVGAVKMGDPRLKRNKEDNEGASTSKIRQSKTNHDDDSDWD